MNKEQDKILDDALDNEDDAVTASEEEAQANAAEEAHSELAEPELTDPAEMAARIAELEDKNAALADQFVRAKAETDNTRRIAEQEKSKARKFALESFSKELLQVKDSLDQASLVKLDDNAEQNLVEQMREGLALTVRQMEQVFDKFNIEEVNPEAGDDLDPELHQPMTMQPSEEISANKIIQTMQKGFTLNDRLLRPAMVIVSSGKA